MHDHDSPVGQKFHRLTVKEKVRKQKGHGFEWLCECDCGQFTKAAIRHLKNGHKKSCGCLKIEKATEQCLSHGKSRSSEYGIWSAMKFRCTNESGNAYHHYGGRGITVCDRWLNNFEAFLEDMGPRPSRRHSLERIDNDGNYEPGNVRWATQREQCQNTRRTKWIEYGGKTKKLQDWAKTLKIPHDTLYTRIFECGWTVERAFTAPPRKLYEFNGESKALTAWARELDLPYTTIYKKVVYGKQDFFKVISKMLDQRSA